MGYSAPKLYTSVWNGSTPTTDPGDGSTVVLGMRIRAINPGRLLALRYLRNLANNGEHLGFVFNAAGDTFVQACLFPYHAATGSGPGGWETKYLARPLHMNAGDEYVIGVWHQTGGYFVTLGALASGPMSGPDIEFPQDGDGGSNGLYTYYTALTPAFTYGSSAYSVDALYLADL